MKDKAVCDTAHCMLADTEVECPALSVLLGEVAIVRHHCIVGWSQVCRAAHQVRECGAQAYQGLSAGTAGCNLVTHIELRQLDIFECAIHHECAPLFHKFRICFLPCIESLAPAVIILLPAFGFLLEVLLGLREDIERFIGRNSQCLPGCKNLLIPKGSTVNLMASCQVRSTLSDHRLEGYECRSLCIFLCLGNQLEDTLHIVCIAGEHLPVVCGKPCLHILGEC